MSRTIKLNINHIRWERDVQKKISNAIIQVPTDLCLYMLLLRGYWNMSVFCQKKDPSFCRAFITSFSLDKIVSANFRNIATRTNILKRSFSVFVTFFQQKTSGIFKLSEYFIIFFFIPLCGFNLSASLATFSS